MKKTIMMLLALVLCIGAKAQTNEAFSGKVVADEGTWCWFADPRALHYENEKGTINATYVGYIDSHGSIKATQVDWKTKTTNEVLVRSWFQPDDHNNPAFLVLPDERIMLIYSRHTDEACFYYRISKRPGDITSLGEEKRLATANNTTYPNPYILADDPDHIYMCWRGIGWHPTVAQMSMPDENDDIKFTWGPYQMVQSTGARPYAKYMSDGKSKIYLAYTTGHPDNENPNWLYCNVFDINDKNLYDIKGVKLSTVQNGTFKVEKTPTYKSLYPNTIVDATDGKRDWIWNMAFDTKGNPVIGMTKISPDKQDHQYYYAKWTGSKWNVSFIANGGKYFHLSPQTENCYSAGMAIDRDEPNIVYCGVPVNGVHEIWKYTLDENDKVVASEAITKGSKKANARPFVIEGTKNAKDGADALRLSWMNGDYYYWIVNTNYPKGYPTSIMAECDLPENLTATSGKTAVIDLQIKAEAYKGEVLTCGNVTYGVDNNQHAYVKVGDKTYTSQNVLGTADSWATEDKATTDGKWYSKTKLGRFNLTMTADSKYLTVYVNGIIDMQIDVKATLGTVEGKDNATIYSSKIEDKCQTQSQIKRNITQGEIEAIAVPAEIKTDVVLPGTTPSGKTITWTSGNSDVLSALGIANLPVSATEVTLTAEVAGITKDFTVTVCPRNIENNVRASLEKLDQTKNTASGFATNTIGKLDEGLLKGLRSYTVVLEANAKSLTNAPRLYDFGGASGNSVFLRANALSAGIKYNGGTTTMVNSSVQLKTNTDYKLAVTFDAATKTTKIYIDGEEVVSGTANQNEPYMVYESAGDGRNYVGRTQWWDNGSEASKNVDFVGTISNLVVYDIALTQKEICNVQGIEVKEKEYATEFVNGDFEASYSPMANSGVTNDRAIYVPEGWNISYAACDVNDLTALKAGDYYYSNFFAGKPQNAEGGKQTMWIRQRWNPSVIDYNQEVKLAAGKYTLTADMISSDISANNTAIVYVDKVQRTPSATNKWETVTIQFEAGGENPVVIGAKADHKSNEFICGFDNFKLTLEQATGMESVSVEASAPQGIFDITGRRLNAIGKKGIYVVDGKKVIR